MRKLIFIMLLGLTILLPTEAYAEERTDYLLYASQQEIERIQEMFPHYTQSFDVIPMVEVSLTRDEVKEIQQSSPEVEIFPVLDYEVAAVETIPTQFELIKTTPEQTSPYTGKGVKVGIVDSGIATNHEDLKVKGGICTLKFDCPKGIPYMDDLGHGTHVAGIIAAQKNGKGIVGIAPEVELYSIKVINYLDMGTTTQIALGVEWAIKNKMDILNMSITTRRDDPALKLLLEKAYHAGILLVGAAGNEERGALQNSVQYPAKYSTVIAVGAVNDDKTRLSLSSLGPEVEVAAPGNKIFSAYPNGVGYERMSGTSMASPHVVGISALYKEQHPSLTNYQIRGILTNAAEDIGALGRDREFGYGLVQYDKLAAERPIVSHYEENGKIIVELSNVEQVTEQKLTVGNAVVKELSPGKWEVYKLAGAYKASASFKHDGKLITHPFDINVDALNYTDMNPTRWYSEQVAYLAHNERVYGYSDHTFRPGQTISRAEALALLGRAYGLDGKKRQTKFKDVGINNFASGYIQSAVEEGLVTGFPDGTFRPNDAVTRAEMSLLLQEAFKFPIDTSIPLHFTDMSENVVGYDAVRALTQKGIIQGYPSGQFKPGEPMTRAVYSVFLAGAERPDIFHVKE